MFSWSVILLAVFLLAACVPEGVLPDSTTNTVPTVVVNADATARVGTAVLLSASVSDPDGDALSYLWTLTTRPAGSRATLISGDVLNTSFVPDVEGTYAVQLAVNDGTGTGTDSAAVTAIANTTGNTLPVADAGADISVTLGSLVSLSGSGTDADNDSLSFSWSLVASTGSTTTLSNAATVSPSFRPDIAGDYTARLIVNDGTADSAADSVLITVLAPAGTGDVLTTLDVSDQGGAEQRSLPFTFGQVFKPGDVPAGKTIILQNGSFALPTQVDAKVTHADGSLRHAIISTRLPVLAANGRETVSLVLADPPASSATPLALSELLNSGFSTNVTVNIGGTVYSVSADELLRTETESTWLKGGEVAEWVVKAPLKTAAGAQHPHLTARFNVRAYAGMDSIRVDVVIENNWAYQANPQNFVYDATVSVCGTDVYQVTGLTHYHRARWRKIFWCGTRPQVHVAHDVAYLLGTGALPNYDQTLVVSEADLAQMEADWTGTKIEPMGQGFLQAYMPGTGGRRDIGPLPRWVARYLLSQDPRAKTVTLGNADLAGSWPIHFRDINTDLPVSLNDRRKMSIKSGNTYDPQRGVDDAFPACGGDCATPYTPDSAHQPSLVYVPYLVTGDYYYLEELLFWANYNIVQANPEYRDYEKGLVKWEQVRGQAWSLRTLGHAAYITPDSHSMKQYFTNKVEANLAYFNTRYSDNASAPALGFVINGNAIQNESGGIGKISPWNDDALTTVVNWLVSMGFSNAIPFRDWKVKFVYGRFANHPVFCQKDAATYRYTIQETYQGAGGPVISDWATLLAASFPSHVDNCPTAWNSGNPRSPQSYLTITRGALAAAVDAGYGDARTFLADVARDQEAAGADFNSTPQWAIVPH